MEPDDLTPVWFSSVLAVDISAVKCTPIGVGMVGLNLRCELVGDGRHPTSVLVKLPSADPTSRATGVSLRNYEREVKFYDEIAPTVGIRAPRCYHGSWDAASGDFVLVLEDAAPAEPGDQIKGCWWSQAQAALIELAHLHAPRWGDPQLFEIDWLTRRDPPSVDLITSLYRHFWPEFLERYGDSLPTSQRSIGVRLGEALPAWLPRSTLPPTVTHGDCRLHNLLFASERGGDAVIALDVNIPIQRADAAGVKHGILGARTDRSGDRVLVVLCSLCVVEASDEDSLIGEVGRTPQPEQLQRCLRWRSTGRFADWPDAHDRSRVPQVIDGSIAIRVPSTASQPDHEPACVIRVISTKATLSTCMVWRASSTATVRALNNRSASSPSLLATITRNCSIGFTTSTVTGPTVGCPRSNGALLEA